MPADASQQPADAQRLRNPIIEMVVDIACELRPDQDLVALEPTATALFRDGYPNRQKQMMFEQQMQLQAGETPAANPSPMRSALAALRYHQADGKQIVQIRDSGFSFNRLKEYTSFDDYLPEIRRTWEAYCRLVEPVKVRQLSLRYINQVLLPLKDGTVDLDEYLALGPKLADQSRLRFTGFLHQHAVHEPQTGNEASITLTTQAHGPSARELPIILDIAAHRHEPIEIGDWTTINAGLASLRSLKNHIFEQSLTLQCRHRYQSLP